MDVSMADASNVEGHEESRMDLIKTVRALDQSGPGKQGENLEKLWKNLTASADGRFHAAEESSLRWLLKSMNGQSQDAELLRRWPLCWTILRYVFQRIPLFSLAKSLADRRFIVVLQQTLKDASKPSTESAPSSPKRKRTATKDFALDDMKDASGCLMTGDAVFKALRQLLERVDSSAAQSSHDRIGAEHIRSLFSAPASEAVKLASMSFSLCALALTSDGSEQVEERGSWIQTISAIWDLHLQGDDDTTQVATHLFPPSASILDKTARISRLNDVQIAEKLRSKWAADMQIFMHRNFIIPSRALFISRQDFEAVTMALSASSSNIAISAPALYFLASGLTDSSSEGRLRKGSGEWMKRVFQAAEEAVRDTKDRDQLIQKILERAVERSTPVDTDDLRSVCRGYALHDGSTNWRLVADIVSCDPDIFQLSEDGASLLDDVCERSTAGTLDDVEADAVSRVIGAISQGFRTGRDFTGFLKLWFRQLCKIEKQKSATASPWLRVGTMRHGKDDFSTLVEKELTALQLRGLLDWVETEKSHSRALCLFLNAVAEGVRSETYVDAAGLRFFELVAQVKKSSSPMTSLKWGVVSKTLGWVDAQQRSEVWSAVHQQLSKILGESPTPTRETFEAFKCCCQAWVSMSPDDEHIEETAKLVENFTVRLAAELATSAALQGRELNPFLSPDNGPDYLEDAALEHYLAWYLRGSQRLNRLFYGKTGAIPQVLQNALIDRADGDVGQLKGVWGNLLSNENNINDTKVTSDLINRLIAAVDQSGTEKRWPGEASQAWIRALAGIPTDAFTRQQRERVMTMLHKHRKSTTKRIPVEGWKSLLSLCTKMMGRPTFYEDMKFSDNIDVADAMSDLSSSTSANDGTLSDLIEAYFEMASSTLRQMAEHLEDRSIQYFEASQKFITNCNKKVDKGDLSPFRLTLLKALVIETSSNWRGPRQLATLPESAKETLGKCIISATQYFMKEKAAFEEHNVTSDLRLLAAVDAAESLEALPEAPKLKSSDVKKAEKRSHAAMVSGDVRGWKMQTFLRRHYATQLDDTRPTTFHSLDDLPAKFREPLLKNNIAAITREMDTNAKLLYLQGLVEAFGQGSATDGQALTIQLVVDQLLECTDLQGKGEGFDLAAAHSELTTALPSVTSTTVASSICRTLYTLLDRKQQSMTQWNIELTMHTVCDFCSTGSETAVPYAWLCKLVEAVIKKHRLRLEGHHHLLLGTMQALMRDLVTRDTPAGSQDKALQESKAQLYARLVTLICEPTAGAVSRSQYQSALDSATDAAKRSAGRHVYLILMQYVKLQLEGDVPRVVREALEPAMNSIFDVTPPEARKILNDAMDGSGRAILREMFKRYTKFGKWSGV